MLALFYGTDRTSIRDRAQNYLEEQGIGPAGTTQISEGEYRLGKVIEAAGAQSLFGGTECFLLDTPSSNAEFEIEVTNNLGELSASKNIFIVLEGSLLAPAKKKYEKHTNISEQFAADKAERFNTFAMAEALVKKDKKNLWVLLHQARATGVRDEEIIGILWWQLKSLRLAAVTNSAEEAEMKDYPYNKAKQALRNFKAGEVLALSQSLLVLYHEGHQGLKEMGLSLEGWVLGV